MTGVLATVGGQAADTVAGIGFQFVTIASVAFLFGALRLLRAKRSKARLFLAVGTLLLAIGVTTLLFESYGAIELDYYPEWKKDYAADDEAMLDMMEEESLYIPIPDWWEGPVWWGQRVLRLAGMSLAAVGFFLLARATLREGSRRTA